MALRTTRGDPGGPAKGRGAPSNLEGRYEAWRREAVDDGWGRDDEALPQLRTEVTLETAKSIIARNDSPDIPFDQSINPYRGCEHGCVYCLAGDTRILMADGSFKALAELGVGDEIYGTGKRGHYREYVRTRVLAHWRTVKPAYRIRLEDGTELLASADHRFLTERGWKFVARAVGNGRRPCLTLNNTLMGFGTVAKPASGVDGRRHTSEYRRGYLCGLIRGDGHLHVYRYTRLGRANGDQHRFRLAMADEDALDRAARFLSGFGVATDSFLFQAQTARRRPIRAIRTSASRKVAEIARLIEWPDRCEGDWARGFVAGIFDAEGSFNDGILRISNTDATIIDTTTSSLSGLGFDAIVETARAHSAKPVHYVRVRGGLREHLRFFGAFDPSIARKRNIEGQAVKSKARLAIAEIENLGQVRELFDIATGTGDFVANGVISHNCYARPTHAYLGLSPGLDFETRIVAKANAAELLRKELAAPGYRTSAIALGANTDPYQPIERDLRITRSILEVLAECEHPFTIVTKNALVERDVDLVATMAAKRMAHAYVSVTNLDADLARKLEPRASAPYRRLETIRRLAEAGIPVGVLVAPLIPFVTDRYMEEILERAREAGATSAGYILLRLPHEVAPLFKDWLATHYPLKAEHVMSLVRQMRGGKDYESGFGVRQTGKGNFAELIGKRFDLACERLGLNHRGREPLDTSRFRPPRAGPQLDLF
jgi:DNA repair photolyase